MQLESPVQLEGGSYLRIRYEDFALLPQVVAELVYCWSGLGEVPSSLAAWIDDNTKMGNCQDPTRRQLALAGAAAGGEGGGGGGSDGDGAREGMGGAVAVAVAVAGDERGSRGGEGGAGVSPRTGHLRRADRVTSPPSALDTQSVLNLPPRHNQSSPSGLAAAKIEDPVKMEGPLKMEGPEPLRLDSATRGEGRGGAAGGQEESDGSSSSLSQSPRRVARKAAAAATAAGGKNAGARSSCDNRKHSDEQPYGTKRHSSQMADLWRTQMPAQDARAVWDACLDSNVMQELQYSL